MDAFFASIEQAINPRLKGKPLIVGSRGNKLYTVVCAASYEAKALGIHSGMPTKDAFQICPKAEFVAADQGKYIWTSQQIYGMLKDYSLEAAYASIDEFRLDIGQENAPLELAKDIQARIYANFNITASIGIAKNSLLAKLASKINKPNGICLLTETNLREVLGKTPVAKIAGVGPKTELLFTTLGIKTCLDLHQKTARFLKETLGKYGLNLYASLHATEHLESTNEEEKPKSISHSYTFPRTSETMGFIKAWLRLLSEMVSERLRSQNLVSNTIKLWLNGPQMGNFCAQNTITQETDDGYEIYSNTLKILAKTGLKRPKIRAIGVSCSNLKIKLYPPLLIEQKKRGDLLETLDNINNRYGEGSIYPAIVIKTRKMA